MPDKTMPNRAANVDKAEGERWPEERASNQVRNGEDILGRNARGRHSRPRRYDEDDAEPARPSPGGPAHHRTARR